MQKQLSHSFLFTIVIILFTSPLFYAQDDIAAAKTLNGDERCWGLNFMWQKDFTVGKQLIDRLNLNPSTQGDESVTGFGLDWYLNPKSSINFLGSLGISSDESESTSGKNEFSAKEIGIKAGWNYHPLGMKIPVYWSFGPWISYVSYSDEDKITPAAGDEITNEFSASRIGLGVNVSAYLKPWNDLNWEFYAGYNLGAFITPESTTKINNEETKGPSSFHLQDCGGMVGTRFFFDRTSF